MPTPLIAPPSWLKPDDPDYNLLVYGQKDSRQEDPVKAAEDFLAQPDVTTNGQQTNAQTADQYLADHGLTMPQVGERRSGPTETVEWDGSRWNPIAQTSAEAGYHPGLNTSPTEAMLQGFLSGASEGALSPQGKAAISGGAALLGPAGIPVAAGVEGLAALLGTHYGVSDAPQSFGEAAADVAEPTASTALFGTAIPAGLKYAATLPKTVTGIGGAALGGYEGYKHGGIPGAIEGAALGGTTGASAPRLLRILGGLTGGAADTAEEASGFAGQPRGGSAKTVNYGGPEGDAFFNRATNPGPAREPNPFTSSAASEPPASGVRPAGTKGSTLNDALDGILNDYRQQPAETPYAPNTNPTPDVRSVDRGNLTVPPEPSPAAAAHSAAEEFNIRQNAPYGEGAIMPSAVQPTEFRAAALDGLNAPQTAPPHDVDYQLLTGKPYLPASEVVDTPDVAQTSPSNADVEDLIRQIPETRTAGGNASIPASLRALDTHTGDPSTIGEWFDRGSFDTGAQAAPLKGEEGYAYDPTSANLRADPQTAINDLLQAREDALQRGDVAAARGYSHDISQRNKAAFNIATGKRLPFKKGISVLKVKMPAVAGLATPDIPF